jgi:hypothetical protein
LVDSADAKVALVKPIPDDFLKIVVQSRDVPERQGIILVPFQPEVSAIELMSSVRS